MFLDYQKRGAVSNRAIADPQRRWLSWVLIGCMLLPVALAMLMVRPYFWPRSGYGPTTGHSSARLDIHNISATLEKFRDDNGRYPTTAEGLNALVQPPAGNLPNWEKMLDVE